MEKNRKILLLDHIYNVNMEKLEYVFEKVGYLEEFSEFSANNHPAKLRCWLKQKKLLLEEFLAAVEQARK